MNEPEERTGVWLIGALGSLSTTTIAGTRLVAQGLAPDTGISTFREEFAPLELMGLARIVFGGHEVRSGSLFSVAKEISLKNHSLPASTLDRVQEDLSRIDARIRPGIATGSGQAIESMDEASSSQPPTGSLRAIADQLVADLVDFREEQRLSRLIVINLASTEPPVDSSDPRYRSIIAFEEALDRQSVGEIRPGALYAYAAFRSGAAYINFTPSGSCLCSALEELALERGLPYAGDDGKTGETLVKSALAPLFAIRGLPVDSWVGYNLLGNRDGAVLTQDEHRQSKVRTKDSLLPAILGYRPQTRVGIDFVRSLDDLKVAWDFIHFRGFLEFPMSLQFTWQGCDSILAAPLVIDLARLMDEALRRGAAGPQAHLACFFKSPRGVDQEALVHQYDRLLEYARNASL